MSYILEGLYVGDIEDACNTTDLREKKGITHILTIDRKPLPLDYTQGFMYKHVYSLDVETSDLLSYLDDCIQFIDEGRSHGNAIIVHCFAGQSRSGAIALAYVMKALDLSLTNARILVRKQRPCIRPNDGFIKQLEFFEAMGCSLDVNNPEYRKYRLTLLSQQILAAQSVDDIPRSCLSADPTSSPASGAVYKCRKCRRPLFRASAVMMHDAGAGDISFRHRVNATSHTIATNDSSRHSDQCVASLFIEPVGWMEETILQLNGKLSCPKCSSKIGTFNWAGDRCCCGTWVTPAFHMQLSKLDLCSPATIIINSPLRPGNNPYPGNTLSPDNTETSTLTLTTVS